MVGVKLEEHMDRVASKVLNTPHDASCFEFQGRKVKIVGGSCSTTNIDDGVDRDVRPFLFERGSKAVDAGITAQAKRSRLVDNSVPIREEKYRWGCEFREEGALLPLSE